MKEERGVVIFQATRRLVLASTSGEGLGEVMQGPIPF